MNKEKLLIALGILPGLGTCPMAQAAQNIEALSPLGMFLQADWVVKAVMLGLLAASVLTWTICLAKTWELRRARTLALHLLTQLRSAPSLRHTLDASHGDARLGFLAAADTELKQSQALPAAGIKERLERRLTGIQSVLIRRANSGTGWLASIGSTGPFLGLFGTVWGIMNSFIGIAEAQTTSLAVVAPGIAEALLATALGLVAAIPAVLIYNALARKIAEYRANLQDVSNEIQRLVSLHLDEREGVYEREYQ